MLQSARQTHALVRRCLALWRAVALACALGGLGATAAQAQAEPGLDWPDLVPRLQALAQQGARQGAPAQARVEVELGRLDPRLRLAPCQQVQPYLPTGQRMWGRSRIGLRCLQGRTLWNVSLPIQVRVWAQAYVAVADLAAGTPLTQEHLRLAETDIAADSGAVYTQVEALLGRQLVRPLAAGEPLRSAALKLRQWISPGERVQVLALGQGYAVSGEGQAMGVGLEGQEVRVRFDNGRIATGRAIGERKVEVLL
jgi:flagella basal body P-ring formation protein FlgA